MLSQLSWWPCMLVWQAKKPFVIAKSLGNLRLMPKNPLSKEPWTQQKTHIFSLLLLRPCPKGDFNGQENDILFPKQCPFSIELAYEGMLEDIRKLFYIMGYSLPSALNKAKFHSVFFFRVWISLKESCIVLFCTVYCSRNRKEKGLQEIPFFTSSDSPSLPAFSLDKISALFAFLRFLCLFPFLVTFFQLPKRYNWNLN